MIAELEFLKIKKRKKLEKVIQENLKIFWYIRFDTFIYAIVIFKFNI